MSKGMLGGLSLSVVQGPRDDFEQKLAGEDGEVWLREFRRFLRRETCWVNGQMAQVATPRPVTTILKFVSTIVIPAITSKFVAKKKFVVNIGSKAPVKISGIWNKFDGWFLSGKKDKIEGLKGKTTLRYHDLVQRSVDGPIIAELGGEVKTETTLSEMHHLMEKQKHGEDGVLLNNGYANIFYVKDVSGVLRAVHVYWDGDGWNVHAYPVGHPRRWAGGDRVFSRPPAQAGDSGDALFA